MQAGLAEAKEIQAACRAAGVAIELGRDDHCTKGCSPKVLLLARPADLPALQHIVSSRWASLLDEGVAVVGVGIEADGDEEAAVPRLRQPRCSGRRRLRRVRSGSGLTRFTPGGGREIARSRRPHGRRRPAREGGPRRGCAPARASGSAPRSPRLAPAGRTGRGRPDEERRHLQRAPAVTEDEAAADAQEAGDALDHSEHAVEVAALMRDVGVEQVSSSFSAWATWISAQNLRFPSRVGLESSQRPSVSPMSGIPSGSSISGTWLSHPMGLPPAPARDAARGVEGQRQRQEAAEGVGHDVHRVEVERIEHVAEERAAVIEEFHATVIERVGQPVTRAIDGEHAVMARQRREDRHPVERAVQPAVDQQQGRAGAELQELGLALRPPDPADARVGRTAGEEGCLSGFEIGVRVHVSPPRR
jgi:hypothetical protein